MGVSGTERARGGRGAQVGERALVQVRVRLDDHLERDLASLAVVGAREKAREIPGVLHVTVTSHDGGHLLHPQKHVGRVPVLCKGAILRRQLDSLIKELHRTAVVAYFGVRAAPVREDARVRGVALERARVRALGAFQVVQAHAGVAQVCVVRGVARVRFHRFLEPRFRLEKPRRLVRPGYRSGSRDHFDLMLRRVQFETFSAC
mmetsp:Transcript_21662/g.64719  ORF Transcript_21662/g.64719 Transcript_21662/m.64719 type:complete len:204 (-) Transcript_21662:164-775(-)